MAAMGMWKGQTILTERVDATGGRTGGPTRLAQPTVEWPTLAVAMALYGGFAALTWFADVLPWWLVLPLGAYVVCWHGTLQHEVVHGHPTPWPWLNELMVVPSLWLWLPFRLYRELHLAHHRNELLTDPLEDPESYYVTQATWARLGPVGRWLLVARNTAAGRLLIGPLVSLVQVLWAEAWLLARGELRHVGHWLMHLVGVAVVLAWVMGVCGMSLGAYVVLFALPGLSLTMLRSFLEHRAAPNADERTAIVEAGPVMSLLYFNNNLHAVHHAHPGLAWYKIPERYRHHREAYLRANGGYLLNGYGEVVLRYLFTPKERPVHPGQPILVAIRNPASITRH
jgi:fatty acid desaturase